MAFCQSNYPLAELLLENGAIADDVDPGEMKTLLHILLRGSEYYLELVELFDDTSSYGDLDQLSEGALDEIYERHETAIFLKFCKILLEKGVDVNACNKEGETALMFSFFKAWELWNKPFASQQEQGVVELLLANGADPRYGKITQDLNTLHLMALSCKQRDWSRQLSYMQEKCNLRESEIVNQADIAGYTPLHIACENLATCGSDKDAFERVKNFIQFLIEECGGDVQATVLPKGHWKRGSQRKLADLELSIDDKTSWREDNTFAKTGKFTCLHFLAFVKELTDDLLNLIQMITNRIKDNLKSNPNGIGLDSRCKYGRTALHLAIICKNTFVAKYLIDAGANIDALSENEANDNLQNPLSMALMSEYQSEIFEALLNAGADPNVKDGQEGRTALSHAVGKQIGGNSTNVKDHLELVATLIKAGADVNSTDKNNRTPLHHCVNASSGALDASTEVAELLLENGANPLAIDGDCRTPIFYAFYKLGRERDTSAIDPISIVTLLCECDHVRSFQCWDDMFMSSRKDIMGRTPIDYAAMRGASVSIYHMNKFSRMRYNRDKEGNTPLTLALRSGHHDCALMLLHEEKSYAKGDVITLIQNEEESCNEVKKKLQEPKIDRRSAFQLTIEKKWDGLAHLMLASGEVPLIEAFRASLNARRLQLTWTLLKKQRKPEVFHQKDEKDCNLMHVLVAHANIDIRDDGVLIQMAKYLMEKGVDSSALDKDGISALHLAAHHAHFGFCKLLLSADMRLLDKQNQDGMTPLAAVFDAAFKEEGLKDKHVKVIKYFIEQGVKTLDVRYYTNILNKDRERHSTTIFNDSILLKNKGDFSENKSSHNSMFGNNEDSSIRPVEYLLANGADINFTNHDGVNPIMLAIDTNYIAMVELLLKYKEIDLDVKKDGRSLMHLCVGRHVEFIKKKAEIFGLLKENGASLEEVDNEGNTPLYYAMRQPSGILANLFPDHLKKDMNPSVIPEEIFPSNSTIDEYWKHGEINVEEDARKEREALSDTPKDPVPPLHKYLKIGRHGVVCFDEEDGVYLDVVVRHKDFLKNSDLYQLQVARSEGKPMWVLSSRRGRRGTFHKQCQASSYDNQKEAYDAFKKVFKSITGYEWGDYDASQKKQQKYYMVLDKDNLQRVWNREGILQPFNLEKCPKSNLPDGLQRLLKVITDRDVLKMDYTLPLGLLRKDDLGEALELTYKIWDLYQRADKSASKDERRELHKELLELDDKAHLLAPQFVFYNTRRSKVDQQYIGDRVSELKSDICLSVASEILLAAQHNKTEINPLDYCYRALGVHCEIMDHSSKECQYILELIENYNLKEHSPVVEGIYRISRPSEESILDDCGVKNRQLLWFGAYAKYVIAILKHGLHFPSKCSSDPDVLKFLMNFKTTWQRTWERYEKYPRKSVDKFVFLCEAEARQCTDQRDYRPDLDKVKIRYLLKLEEDDAPKTQ